MTTEPKKITRSDLLRLFETLDGVKGCLTDVMAKWTVAALRQKLRVLVEPITEVRTGVLATRPDEFHAKREELCRSYAAKSPSGDPIVASGAYVIDPAHRDTFDAALAKLRADYKDSIEKFDRGLADFNAFLKTTTELPDLGLRLKLAWFTTGVTPDQLEVLFDLIESPVKEAP